MAKGTPLGDLYFSLGINDEGFAKKMAQFQQKFGKDISIKVKLDLDMTKVNELKSTLASIERMGLTKGVTPKQSAAGINESNKGLIQQQILQERLKREVEKTAAAHSNTETRIKKNTQALEFQNKSMLNLRQASLQLSNQFGTMFSIYAVERFVEKLATVRGEFELQQISLRAILQDAPAADKIFNQVKALAVQSPFTFKNLIDYTKQLSAFSVPANELYTTMKNLADVSAGLGVDMGRITLAFGQVKAASVLRGQELRQFTEAGIPLVAELANKFSILEGRTVSAGEVFDKISKRMVSFGMVSDIFDEMTSAGGKFYEMQEKQAQSLQGKISNLTDSFEIALNNIGEANDGILKGGVEGLTALVNNWQDVVKVLGSVIAVYGTYNAVLAFNTLLSSKAAIGISVQVARILMLNAEMGIATAAQYAYNMAVSANPLMLFAALLAAVVGGLILFSKHAKTAKDYTDDLSQSVIGLENSGVKIDKLNQQYKDLTSVISTTKEGSLENAEAQRKLKIVMEELSKVVPSTAVVIDEYNNILAINTGLTEEYTAQQARFAKSRVKSAIDEAEARIKILQDANTQARAVIADDILPDKIIKGAKSAIPINEKEIANLKKLISDAYDSIQKYNRDNWSKVNSEAKSGTDKYFNLTSDWVSNINKEIGKLNWAGMTPPSASGGSSVRHQDGTWRGKFTHKVSKTGLADDIKKDLSEGLDSKEFSDVFDKISKAYNEAKEKFELNKKGTIFSKAEIETDRKNYEAYKSIFSAMGGVDKEQARAIKKEETAAQKAIAENLKSRISLIKEAYSEYDKLKKAGFSASSAAELINQKGSAYENVKSISAGKTVSEAVGGVISSPEYKNGPDSVKSIIADETRFIESQNLEQIANNKEKLVAFQKQYATYIEKVNEINKKASDATAMGIGDPSRLREIEIERKKSIEDLDKSMADRSDDYKSYVENIVNLSIQQLKTELSNLSLLSVGARDEDKAILKAKIAELRSQLSKLLKENENKQAKEGAVDWSGTIRVMNNVDKSVNKITDSFENLSDGVKESLSAITKTTGGIISIIEGVTSLSAKSIDATTGLAVNSIKGVERASVILTIIATALQIATAIVNIFSAASKRRKEAAEKERQAQLDAYFGLVDYNMELRKQYDLTQQIGESRLAWIEREAKALNDQKEANEKLQKDLMWGDTAHSITYQEYGLNSNLAGKSYEELSKLASEGKLSKEGMAFYEAVKKAHDEGVDLIKLQEEFLESQREMFTGTTYSSLADSIIEGFKAGKRSAADFADTFQQLMQTAVQASLSLQADAKTREWFDKFAEASQSGGVLTPDEQAKLKQEWDAMILALGTTAEEIKKTTGVDITTAADTTSSMTKSIQALTEDTGDKLSGYIYTISRVSSENQSILKSMAASISGNDDNIRNSTLYLYEMNNKVTEINTTTKEIRDALKSVITPVQGGNGFRMA